jgi:hypothetical protein
MPLNCVNSPADGRPAACQEAAMASLWAES